MNATVCKLAMFAVAASSTSAAQAVELGPGARYVSMGSSYAAGPGVGLPDPASGACARSFSNFAREVARRRRFHLVDVACSGATIENILVHGQHGFPAQIDAVMPNTQLVSVLIGGNDVGYVMNLLGYSCRDSGGSGCNIVSDADVSRRFATLPVALRDVVAEIHRRARKARIVLVGYLSAIPAARPGVCSAVPLTPDDAARLRDVAVRLARVIGGTAAETGSGIVRSSLIGTKHDACSPDPFIAGAHPMQNPGWPAPVAFHPNQAGMDRIASALNKAIDADSVSGRRQ